VNVAIYCRVSTEKQEATNQLTQLRAFAATQGWNVVGEYVDTASGKNGDREQFKALFAAASRREFGCLLFWSLDRLSREGVFETLQYLQRLTAYGVGYRSFTEQYLDSCGMFRDAVISILAVIAKQERVRLSERTLAGLARARAQGRVGGRPRVPCDHRKVLKLHAAGCSLGEIAKSLKLTKTTVYRIVAGACASASTQEGSQ
jgi:DNA invertase Pin-like site-specific DNA recombinase